MRQFFNQAEVLGVLHGFNPWWSCKSYICLVDAALRNAVLLRGEDILTNSEEMGVIAKTTIHRHLYSFYYRDVPEIVYWRDPATDKEVDIIVRSPNYIIPFEVKYREHPNLSTASGLVTYCRLEKKVKVHTG